MVNAWPPGSANDNILRIVSERLSQRLGQPVAVGNRPGANGTIGTAYVAKAAPDGYTLVFATADTPRSTRTSQDPAVRRLWASGRSPWWAR
jgi:tripartite-type tricarboxylate transporter receptor subunit TctC